MSGPDPATGVTGAATDRVPAAGAADPATQGLTSAEAAARLAADGPNAIGEHAGRTLPRIILTQLASPLVLLLVAACVVSIGAGDAVDAAIILLMVGLSVTLGVVQEARSEHAVAALRARLALTATAIRDGIPREVPVRDLVRGDVVTLAAGEIVPADARLLEANHLHLDESAMTGEPAAARKVVREGAADRDRPEDRDGFVFYGTTVVSGAGRAVIVATAGATMYGLIARRLLEREPSTDFQRGVRGFGLLIARIVLILVVGVLVVNVALGRPLIESLLFAIALAVGLTPELLPAIVTVNLSRGARILARHGVLVRHLAAVQDLGSMTILCTDKTGTLTEGRLILERAQRADGTDDPAVHALARTNSRLQAGFANPLDLSILAAPPPDGVPADDGPAAPRKLAELPFDFERRLVSVLVAYPDGGAQLIAKGAPEAVLDRCTAIRTGATEHPLDDAARAGVEGLVRTAASVGDRTVAVASRRMAPADHVEPEDEAGLTLEGILRFSDPPKAGIDGTIAELGSLHVGLKIVTGDSELVARAVAARVGLAIDGVLTGDELRRIGPSALVARAARTTIFARVDPDQKLQVIAALQRGGAVVGYLGDGINDAPPLHEADVGISVDNATDVARAAADLILLRPGLDAIAIGVREGRRTFANTLKYIRMETSSAFGNMCSMAAASLILPFLPMLPGQVLLNNLVYDLSQTTIPTDVIDPEDEARPERWDLHGIERFMVVFGPISSVFDLATFALLMVLVGSDEAAFHTGWFVESLVSQVLVIAVIRTSHIPFWASRPSRPLALTTILATVAAVLIPFSPFAATLGFVPPPLAFWVALPILVAVYLGLVEAAKRRFGMVRRAAAPAGMRGA